MICRKCGAELPDLTMYCTNCGAAQFENRPQDVVLTMPEAKKTKLIVTGYTNMTKAATKLRDFTGMSIPEVRRLMQQLPFELVGSLSEEEAEQSIEMLKEYGIEAIAETPGKKQDVIPEEMKPEPEPVPVSEPEIVEEPGPEAPVYEELPAEAVEETALPDAAAETEEPAVQENIPHLTLDPEGISDEQFMKEMEEFLNS
ncbi:MAG: zinc ribbon domain-containing protein [Solobacterium sp.]|nr:zinc ribbon domain-containing protein [Solobacterium sp.]